ncbi:MAG: hypothetical protein QXO69_01660 [archaeon]
MNGLSFAFMIFFGLLLGLVFKDLARQFGAKEELASSYVLVLLLPFILIVSFVFVRFFMFFQFSFSDLSNINSLYSSPMLWVAASALAGGAARMFFDRFVLKQSK